jgi:hypothetical protein
MQLELIEEGIHGMAMSDIQQALKSVSKAL